MKVASLPRVVTGSPKPGVYVPGLFATEALMEHTHDLYAENYSVSGVWTMRHTLQREGIAIGREQTARLMRMAALSGRGKGGRPVTTRTHKRPDLRPDLVNREFKAPGPGKLWAADITYVRTRKGFVYTAFVTDVFSRRDRRLGTV